MSDAEDEIAAFDEINTEISAEGNLSHISISKPSRLLKDLKLYFTYFLHLHIQMQTVLNSIDWRKPKASPPHSSRRASPTPISFQYEITAQFKVPIHAVRNRGGTSCRSFSLSLYPPPFTSYSNRSNPVFLSLKHHQS
jgi:hypothetical protein